MSGVVDTTGDNRTTRVCGGMKSALEELQTQNAMLLEAVEEKNKQVQELGTLVESMEPVPGLDPAAFYSALRNGGASGNDQDLDYRDQKIVHLAKRTRALNARLEGEKARYVTFAFHSDSRSHNTQGMQFHAAFQSMWIIFVLASSKNTRMRMYVQNVFTSENQIIST